ncbi:histidine phosphatase family protein [Hylemonella gracilis]|jgi:broad specificity phosphatase PhoE|uniref:Histidine phosphatase family protein n=1 Tax=Hylemonella gracilis TaxID=80880 RepID=A0A4P6UKY3_9BURK|nr:histidine phosphatase family protein [Hylemonella gracilis]QBK04071.1 histidine phosphatase family protein [Hylemonella gracilis]
MPTLYLVRHGQASFGAADYDRLSELGERQSERLGQYWRARGRDVHPHFGTVLTGTLRRHAQTWGGIARGLGLPLEADGGPQALQWPGLDEYDSTALLETLGAAPPQSGMSDTPESRRAHFRLLRTALQQWAAGTIAPRGMPTYADFSAGVRAALDHVCSTCTTDVLIVSSGGPIATAVAQVLGAPAETGIELNLRLRNSAITELDYTPRRLSLVSFNTVPHLDEPGLANWVTYA